ncbi:helix-turn-helix domain-containing protein [Natrialbaceae archaeon A-arb3/5]
MARLFPFRSETAAQDGQPRVVDLEGEDADAVFSALSSTTARRIYAQLDEDPATPSDVADAIDSSIQNVRYHLENLEDAGLVEVVDTWYSSRGNEMSVYATTDGPLIVTSDESTATQLKTALSRLIGGIGALAGGSLLVQYGTTRWLSSMGGQPDSGPASPPPGDESAGEMESDDEPDAAESGDDPAEARDGPVEETDDGETFGIAETDDAEDESEADAMDSPDDVDDSESMDEAEDGAEPTGDEADSTDGVESVADDGASGGEHLSDGGAETADAVFGTVPPGLLFFLGGLVVLLAVTAYWYRYRPAY